MRRIAICLLSFSLAAAAFAIDLEVESGYGVDFSSYTTYAWKQGTDAHRESAQKTIVMAVERELAAAGLHATAESPDVYVATHSLVDRQTLDELDDANHWEFMTGITSVDAYDLGAGTLVIDIIDATSNKIVWRGAASGTVSGPVEKMNRKVDKAIRKLFKRFPPG